MESRLRMLLVLAGLPAPQVNFIVRHPDGSWRMRFDLCCPALKLIIEYDGRQHAMNSAQWQRDLKRREELDAIGWRISVVTAADLYDAPEQVLARVRDALVVRGATGSRRHFKTEWLRYFTALNVVTAVMRDARSSTSGTDRLTAVMRTISDPGDG